MEMKEELTTDMHAEFTVSEANRTKHTIWSIMQTRNKKEDILEILKTFDLTAEDFNRHRKSYPAQSEWKNREL